MQVSDKAFPPPRRFSAGIYWLAAAVLLLAAGGLLLVLRFGAMAYERELEGWQARLNLIADSRAQEVSEWVGGRFSALQALADNASLQLYMTELTLPQPESAAETAEPGSEPPAEAVYLRNLLIVAAQQGGFLPPASAEDAIAANVERPAGGGIAVVTMQWEPVAATQGFPPLQGALKERLSALSPGKSHLLDIAGEPGRRPDIGFAAPVYAIQGDRGESGQIGWAVGLRPADEALFSRLKHPGATEKTLEAVLVRRNGGEAEYISPLMDGSAPLEKRLSLATDNLDAAQALEHPGAFALARDYAFQPVLMTSRAVAGTPWALLLKIGREEALAASENWRGRMMVILLLSVALAIVLIVAAWWYGASREARELAAQQRKLAQDYAEQEQLLRLVTDNQPEALFIVDGGYRCHFANRRAAEMAGIAPADMQGKTLASLMGAGRAGPYEKASRVALDSGKAVSRVRRDASGGAERTLRSEYVPLASIPLAALPDNVAGALIVEQDITEAVAERERRERVLSQLIDTLVRLVDERDPHAANHSAAVARLSRAVAHEMGLEDRLAETAELAGKLMNIGKIALPPELLTKVKGLDNREKGAVSDALTGSARILEAIEFDGPVVATLRQAKERYDGGGPDGLAGETILVTARIVAAVNAFVAMTSPRSWREAIGADEATKMLLEEANKAYDRRVIAALINYLDNRGGRAELEAERKAAAGGV